jgi:hypothetical protein
MQIKQITLIYKSIIFYTKEEENTFFECLKEASCIKQIKKTKDEIILYIELIKGLNHIPYIFKYDFYIIKCVFNRYKLDLMPLIKLKQREEIFLSAITFNLYNAKEQLIILNWIKLIPSIKKYQIYDDSIDLNFYTTEISKNDLKNLAGLFDRYNLTRTEIKNAHRIKESKEIYQQILNKKNDTYDATYSFDNCNPEKPNKNSLTIKNLKFYSKEDEEIFYSWLQEIDCISSLTYIKKTLYINIKYEKHIHDGPRMSAKNFNNLKIIFNRYKIPNPKQLLIFNIV